MEQLLNKVKDRLSIVYDEKDKIIQGYIDEISDKIKSVCNREDVPKKLEYLVIKYAMNCAVYYKNGYGESKQIIASISDNGQSVSYKDNGAISADDVDLDKYIEKNRDEISMYAYMRW